jgi:hypothetical protein
MIGEPVTIYVELADEGVDCWRPVKAERVATDTFRIVDLIPPGERWRFQPGEVVRCKKRKFSDGMGLAAYERLN